MPGNVTYAFEKEIYLFTLVDYQLPSIIFPPMLSHPVPAGCQPITVLFQFFIFVDPSLAMQPTAIWLGPQDPAAGALLHVPPRDCHVFHPPETVHVL